MTSIRTEGLRKVYPLSAPLTPEVPQMPLPIAMGALLVIAAFFWIAGFRSFRKRAIG